MTHFVAPDTARHDQGRPGEDRGDFVSVETASPTRCARTQLVCFTHAETRSADNYDDNDNNDTGKLVK